MCFACTRQELQTSRQDNNLWLIYKHYLLIFWNADNSYYSEVAVTSS